MDPIILLANDYVSLWHHPDENIIHHKINKFVESASFRAMLTAGAECLEKHRCKKWLSDDKDSTVIRDGDAEWATTVWSPRVIRAGFKYWAIVLPSAAIGQLNMKRFADEYRHRGVTVSVFDNVDAAFGWLKAA